MSSGIPCSKPPHGPPLGLFSTVFHYQHVERKASPTIFCLMTLKREPKKEVVQARLHKLIQKYPLFAATISKRKGWRGGTLHWNAGDSSLEAAKGCISYVDSLDCGEGEPSSALRAYLMDKITNLPTDFTDGGFRLLVVTYAGRERCDMVWIIHHAIGDGILLLRVLVDQCDEEERCQGLLDGSEKKTHNEEERRRSEKKTHLDILLAIFVAIRSFWKVVSLLFVRQDKQTKLKAPRDFKLLSPRKGYHSTSPWPVEDLKAAGRPFNASLNDVLMAVLSAAIRKYLLHVQCPVVEANEDLTITNLSIFNTRAMSDMDGLLQDFQKAKTTNDVSFVISTMPVGNMSIIERVKACSKEMTNLKRSPEALIVRLANELLKRVLGDRFVSYFTSDNIMVKFHTIFSNLRGPPRKLKFCGEVIETLSNFVHPSSCGFVFSSMSYNGKLVTNMSYDSDIVKEPELFVKFADDAFREVCEAAAEMERTREAGSVVPDLDGDVPSLVKEDIQCTIRQRYSIVG